MAWFVLLAAPRHYVCFWPLRSDSTVTYVYDSTVLSELQVVCSSIGLSLVLLSSSSWQEG